MAWKIILILGNLLLSLSSLLSVPAEEPLLLLLIPANRTNLPSQGRKPSLEAVTHRRVVMFVYRRLLALIPVFLKLQLKCIKWHITSVFPPEALLIVDSMLGKLSTEWQRLGCLSETPVLRCIDWYVDGVCFSFRSTWGCQSKVSASLTKVDNLTNCSVFFP